MSPRKAMIPELLLQSGLSQQIFQLGRFAEWSGAGESALHRLDELLADPFLLPTMEAAVADVDGWATRTFESVFDFRLFRILLFAALREAQPALVVETGVLHGMTTLFLLRALELNGRGRLISIDLPSYANTGPSNRDGYVSTLPAGKQPGWMAPAARFPQWDLRLGASREVLATLSDVEGLGLFCHDSEHTTQTMAFEFNWAWPRLADGGLLVCDNIEASTAFADFARRVGRTPIYFPAPDRTFIAAPRFAMIRK